MSKKSLLLAGAAVVALSVACAPAFADNIAENQWYGGVFGGSGSPLLAGGVAGSNGPLVGGGTGNALAAPGTTNGVLSAVITVGASGAYLTVTDIQTSGDQFEIVVNGTGADGTGAGNSLLSPGGQGVTGSDTSGPVFFDTTAGNNISIALGDADYSSGTFLLPAGTDTITGTFLGGIGDGGMDFIVTPTSSSVPVPEPGTLSLFGSALIGLGAAGWWRKRKANPRTASTA